MSVGYWVDASGGNLWVIENGLKPGDVVITDGVAKIMPGGPIHLAGAAPAGAPPGGAAPGGASAQGSVGGTAGDSTKAPGKAPAADAPAKS